MPLGSITFHFLNGWVEGAEQPWWVVDPAGYTTNPAAYTANPAVYDPIEGHEDSPWD